jgi:uncharacterized protein YbjT (DUF2867 family)
MPVAEQLKTDGFAVCLLARSPEKARSIFGAGYEISKGDFEDTKSLKIAMQGCDGVHISIKGGPKDADFERVEHQCVKRIVKIARTVGVGRGTLTSAYAVLYA